MPTLSSSIVKAHVASMREVEEALARQVIHGGDLVTNLLELASVSEPVLTLLMAESYELAPAPSGELPVAPESVLKLVPGELALRHAFYPLSEVEGALTIAVSEPLPAEVEGDLSFSMGARIVQLAAPLVRIRQAIARDYGLPLDRRMLRLTAKLEGRADPSPSSMPAPFRDAMVGFPNLPRPASVPPIGYPPVATLRSEPAAPLATPPEPAPYSQPEPPPPRSEAPPSAARSAAPAVSTLITPRHPSERVEPSTPEPPRWLIGTAGRERGRRRHRGPYTAAMAEHDLLDADSRDDVLGAFFDFFSQYFEYSALFAVQGDIAEGRDAHGPGADRERIRAIGVPLDLPSALRAAKIAGALQLTVLSSDGMDSSLAKDLQRSVGRVVLLLPVVVRGRCALLVYGDHGDSDVMLSEVGDVIAFAPLVAQALERLIMKKKLGARQALASDVGRSLTPLPVAEIQRRRRHRIPAVGERVVALARALDATAAGEVPSTLDDSPQARGTGGPPQTVAASPRAISGPSTAIESPHAKAGPSTADESPQAKGQVETSQPATPQESPVAKSRGGASAAPVLAIGGAPRRNTPPHGTPGVLDPQAGEDQPFPLTRRTPSGRVVPIVAPPPSGESPDSVDAGWDLEPTPAMARSAPGPRRDTTPFERETEQLSDVGHEAPLAPASRQIALGPRAPFPRQDAKDRLLPSVIVDVDADCRALLARLLEGDESAGDQLVQVGDPAVSVLVSEFPGPIHPDRQRRFAEAGLLASECGPILRVIARMGLLAVPFVAVRTADRDAAVRRWSTWLLGELPDAEAARAVVRRFSDADAEVRRAALAAGRMMQSDVEARTALRDGLATSAADPAQPPEVRHGSIEALADLRDPRAVPRLVPLLSSDNTSIARSAHWALCTLSRQDFGRDLKAWQAWWQENQARHRVEWLIASLSHGNVDVRRAAGEELKSLTREYFGYYEDLPAKERERAQAAYRQWWESGGKARFP